MTVLFCVFTLGLLCGAGLVAFMAGSHVDEADIDLPQINPPRLPRD